MILRLLKRDYQVQLIKRTRASGGTLLVRPVILKTITLSMQVLEAHRDRAQQVARCQLHAFCHHHHGRGLHEFRHANWLPDQLDGPRTRRLSLHRLYETGDSADCHGRNSDHVDCA